jgi:hypothetical protein
MLLIRSPHFLTAQHHSESRAWSFGAHPDLPAGGHKEDTITIADRGKFASHRARLP